MRHPRLYIYIGSLAPLKKGVQSPKAFICFTSHWMNPNYWYSHHAHVVYVGIWIRYNNPTTRHFTVFSVNLVWNILNYKTSVAFFEKKKIHFQILLSLLIKISVVLIKRVWETWCSYALTRLYNVHVVHVWFENPPCLFFLTKLSGHKWNFFLSKSMMGKFV